MKTYENFTLATVTALRVGGKAEELYEPANSDEIMEATTNVSPLWVLGYGTNSLISEKGLPGRTVRITQGSITHKDTLLIADAGAWWDDVVIYAIKNNLWGIELMSAIPGGVGGAVVGNIAAYGQAISDTLEWIDVYDTKYRHTVRMKPEELELSYRYSNLQQDDRRHYVILHAAFNLSHSPTKDLTYQRALDIAEEMKADLAKIEDRRKVIIEARRQAGSLWDYRDENHESNNAGSFFRNPLVSPDQVDAIIAHDETGTTAEQIKKMNQIHGGNAMRVSAAHVMLAAGYNRGQSWGSVRLHPSHVLKLETLPGANAKDVYDVVQEIQATVHSKLKIDLVPEPRFYGEF